MTQRVGHRFGAGLIVGVLSALAVALVLGLWAGLSFHYPTALRPTAAEVNVNTGTLEVLKPASCNASVTVTVTKLYTLGSGTLLRHQRALLERMRVEQLVFHLPYGMYRVRTSADRSVENRFVLPGVVDSVEICRTSLGTKGTEAARHVAAVRRGRAPVRGGAGREYFSTEVRPVSLQRIRSSALSVLGEPTRFLAGCLHPRACVLQHIADDRDDQLDVARSDVPDARNLERPSVEHVIREVPPFEPALDEGQGGFMAEVDAVSLALDVIGICDQHPEVMHQLGEPHPRRRHRVAVKPSEIGGEERRAVANLAPEVPELLDAGDREGIVSPSRARLRCHQRRPKPLGVEARADLLGDRLDDGEDVVVDRLDDPCLRSACLEGIVIEQIERSGRRVRSDRSASGGSAGALLLLLPDGRR